MAWRPFVGTGLGVLLLLAVLAAVPRQEQRLADTLVTNPDYFWLAGLLTPLLPIAAAVVALGWVERSTGLLVAGGWIAALTVWLCGWFPMGRLPGWAIDVLAGDLAAALDGSYSFGGQLDWRPGFWLILMALPLIAFAAVRGWQSWRTAHHG
ncbi:hypothetical protein F8271_02250 [Micromonospora sp. ALFpr18c]|uniref:hypothetical protein n=1 Tax=unclassified Micromonospora TaxID=2617518 RepID=UPI00124B3B6F|nr:hypothetical protein [Micromonospora sp. ALFpr18c]KAB1948572.1 hypothetical protein F8271_02250 [Micromonospora sp. ALFpr18c]